MICAGRRHVNRPGERLVRIQGELHFQDDREHRFAIAVAKDDDKIGSILDGCQLIERCVSDSRGRVRWEVEPAGVHQQSGGQIRLVVKQIDQGVVFDGGHRATVAFGLGPSSPPQQ